MKIKLRDIMAEEWKGEGSSKRNLVVILGVVIAVVAVAGVVVLWPRGGGGGGGGPAGFAVYGDAGIPAGADIYTWDSYREWQVGTGEATFDANYTEVAGIPEGSKCFLTMSNNGNTYAGWGVFLLAGTSDLSSNTQLKFWVKTSTNLKVGVQQTDASGTKKEVYINSYGWTGTDTWQEITIPKSAFSPVDFTQLYSPFLITVESTGKTFYVDQVRWV